MRRVVAALLCAALAAPRVARADGPRDSTGPGPVHRPPSSTDAVSAQVFFQRGREAAARGDDAEACRNFEESLRLDLAVGTLFNLANCEAALGRVASAWQHLREGIDRLEPRDPRRAPAEARAAELEPRLPRLEVRLEPGAAGRVMRDGVELSALSLGTPLPVNPGQHVVIVRAEEHEDASFEVTLAEGERRQLVVRPGAPAEKRQMAAPAAASSAPPPEEGRPVRTVAWVTGAAGAVSLGAGLVTSALAFERSRVVHNHCEPNGSCDPTGLDAVDASRSYAGVATVTLAVGAGLVATGVVLYLLSKPTDTRRASAALLRF